MAISDAHRLGQMIGIMLEKAIEPHLRKVLGPSDFLDFAGKNRSVRGNKKKVTWVDSQGNKHDLDFVIEQNGTDNKIGDPKAFIECAWRRYTKHSKNKAQEIQGAIIPLAEKYKNQKPFLGVILAGDFTEASLQQLISNNFCVLYITYHEIVDAYFKIGLDISYDEDSSLEELKKKADYVENLREDQLEEVAKNLTNIIDSKLLLFLRHLNFSLKRTISKIVISPLYGMNSIFSNIESAKQYLSSINLNSLPIGAHFFSIFIYLEYSSGENFRAEFFDVNQALDFLSKC